MGSNPTVIMRSLPFCFVLFCFGYPTAIMRFHLVSLLRVSTVGFFRRRKGVGSNLGGAPESLGGPPQAPSEGPPAGPPAGPPEGGVLGAEPLEPKHFFYYPFSLSKDYEFSP